MSKYNLTISLSTELIPIIENRRILDANFNLSDTINNLLKEYFIVPVDEEIKQAKEIELQLAEAHKQVAILKTRKIQVAQNLKLKELELRKKYGEPIGKGI